jgi:hypothetical protein
MEMRLKKLVRSHYQYNVPISLEKKLSGQGDVNSNSLEKIKVSSLEKKQKQI